MYAKYSPLVSRQRNRNFRASEQEKSSSVLLGVDSQSFAGASAFSPQVKRVPPCRQTTESASNGAKPLMGRAGSLLDALLKCLNGSGCTHWSWRFRRVWRTRLPSSMARTSGENHAAPETEPLKGATSTFAPVFPSQITISHRLPWRQ